MNRLPIAPRPQYPILCPKCPKCQPPKVCPRPPIPLPCSALRLFRVESIDYGGVTVVNWYTDEINYNGKYYLQVSTETSFDPRYTREYQIIPRYMENGTFKSDININSESLNVIRKNHYARIIEKIDIGVVKNSNYVTISFLSLDSITFFEVLDRGYQRVNTSTFKFTFFLNLALSRFNQAEPTYTLEIVDSSGNVSSLNINTKEAVANPGSRIFNMSSVVINGSLLPGIIFFNEEEIRRIKARIVVTISDGTKFYSNYLTPNYTGEIYVFDP